MLTPWQKGLSLVLWSEIREKKGESYDVMERIRFNWPSISDEEADEVFDAYQRRKQMRAVSSPRKTPKHVIRCELGHRLYVEQFTDSSYAKLFLDMMLRNEPVKWSSSTEITAKGGVLVVRCDELEDLMEMEVSGDLPDNYVNQVNAFLRGKWEKSVEKEKKRPSPHLVSAKRRMTPLEIAGTVTLREICARNKWEPRTARAAMRNAKWQIPSSDGWAWPKKDAPAIEKKLKGLMS